MLYPKYISKIFEQQSHGIVHILGSYLAEKRERVSASVINTKTACR